MKKAIVIFIILLAVVLSSYFIYTGIKGKETFQTAEKEETILAEESSGEAETMIEGIPLDEEISETVEKREIVAAEEYSAAVEEKVISVREERGAPAEKAAPVVDVPPVIIKEEEIQMIEDTKKPVDEEEMILAEEPSEEAEKKIERIPADEEITAPVEKREIVAAEEPSAAVEEKVISVREERGAPVEKAAPVVDVPPVIIKEEEIQMIEDTKKPVDEEEMILAEEPSEEAEKKIERIPADEEITAPVEKREIVAAGEPPESVEEEVIPTVEQLDAPDEKAAPVEKGEIITEDEPFQDIGDKTEVPVAVIEPEIPSETAVPLPAEAPPTETIMDEAPPIEETIDAGKKEGAILAEETAEEGTGEPVEKGEVADAEMPADEAKNEVADKAEGLPAGGIVGGIVAPIEKPLPVLIGPPSPGMGTLPGVVLSDKKEEQRREKMESPVAEGTPEEGRKKEEAVIPSGVTMETSLKKPGRIYEEMSIKGHTNRVAIFPFENYTDDQNVLTNVTPVLIDRVRNKGFDVVDEDSLNDYLCKERVRSTGYVSKELARKIKEEFNVSTILVGSIISFSQEENPRFGIMARLIDASDGKILWANYAAATGDDFLTVLDLGRVNTIFSLIPRAMDMLFASFNAEGLYRENDHLLRIAVMPFRNNSNFKYAGMIAMYMYIIELLKSQEFVPIEYGNIRNSMVNFKIKERGKLSFANINALSETLGARGIIVGVVDNYSIGAGVSSPPRVGFTVRLINGSNNKIMWFNSYQSSGEENIIVLDWGRIRSVHKLAYTVVSQLMGKMKAVDWP